MTRFVIPDGGTRIACGVGVLARLACAFAGPGTIVADEADYVTLGHSLAEGHGYALHGHVTANWMPGWPAWLSLFFRAGLGLRAVVFGNVALGVLVIVFTGLIARELFDARVGWIAAACASLLPSLVLLPRLMLSENLALPLFAFATWLLVRAARAPSVRRWALFAVATALCLYVRDFGIGLLVAGGFVALLRGPAHTRIISSAAIALITMTLVMPWSIRNNLELGRSRLTTSMGSNACIGFGEGATGGYRIVNLDRTSEIARNDDGFRCARAGLRRDPLSPLTLAPAKLSRFFAYDDWDVDDFFAGPIPPVGSLALRALCNVAYWLLCALAVLGIGEHRLRITPLFLAIMCTAMMAVLSFGVGRFHAPLLPLVAALAASTWYRPAS